MNSICQSAFFKALGWSLIDSLWQIGALLALYNIITSNGNRYSSSKRHALALIAASTGTILFFINIPVNYYYGANHNTFYSIGYYFKHLINNTFSDRGTLNTAVSFLSFLYTITVVIFSVRLFFQYRINKNIYRKGLLPANKTVLKFLDEMTNKIGISKTVRIWLSEKVESPLTIGFLKPLIILPVAALGQLTYEQAKAVIAHELFHIKRNDYLLNLLMMVAEVILFFNPFARMLFETVKKERENSCDDQVLAIGFDAWDYSQTLYILGRYRSRHNELAIAATGKGKQFLLQRVRRLMNRNTASPSSPKLFFVFFLCLFVFVLASRQLKQTLIPQVPKYSGGMPLQVKNRYVTVSDPATKYIKEEEKRATPRKVKRITIVFSRTIIKLRIKHDPEISAKDGINASPIEVSIPREMEKSAITSFVSIPETPEFSMIDNHKPEIQLPVVCESPLPYVPASTFYYTEIDSTTNSGLKEISL